MVIPPILGEALLSGMEIMKGASEANAEISASALIVGFLAAFLSGCACLQMDDQHCQERQTGVVRRILCHRRSRYHYI